MGRGGAAAAASERPRRGVAESGRGRLRARERVSCLEAGERRWVGAAGAALAIGPAPGPRTRAGLWPDSDRTPAGLRPAPAKHCCRGGAGSKGLGRRASGPIPIPPPPSSSRAIGQPSRRRPWRDGGMAGSGPIPPPAAAGSGGAHRHDSDDAESAPRPDANLTRTSESTHAALGTLAPRGKGRAATGPASHGRAPQQHSTRMATRAAAPQPTPPRPGEPPGCATPASARAWPGAPRTTRTANPPPHASVCGPRPAPATSRPAGNSDSTDPAQARRVVPCRACSPTEVRAGGPTPVGTDSAGPPAGAFPPSP
jgi:hypothetical protein